ncbi:hypothetical protein U9M48_001334 [Paspalum notatum var. saurae]|uniref:Uncharacterized protein n=1 Tax=Paspalum notatum var. saurae TaxID=547442 RepID=A0AAQ3PES1_PASNO
MYASFWSRPSPPPPLCRLLRRRRHRPPPLSFPIERCGLGTREPAARRGGEGLPGAAAQQIRCPGAARVDPTERQSRIPLSLSTQRRRCSRQARACGAEQRVARIRHDGSAGERWCPSSRLLQGPRQNSKLQEIAAKDPMQADLLTGQIKHIEY